MLGKARQISLSSPFPFTTPLQGDPLGLPEPPSLNSHLTHLPLNAANLWFLPVFLLGLRVPPPPTRGLHATGRPCGTDSLG